MNDDYSDEAFDNSCVKFTQQDLNCMRDYLCNMYPVLRTMCAVHSCGEILLVNSKKQLIMVDNILHDIGSISANYISKSIVDSFREKLRDKIEKKERNVTLAEKGNVVRRLFPSQYRGSLKIRGYWSVNPSRFISCHAYFCF